MCKRAASKKWLSRFKMFHNLWLMKPQMKIVWHQTGNRYCDVGSRFGFMFCSRTLGLQIEPVGSRLGLFFFFSQMKDMQSTCSFNTYISLAVVLIVKNRARILINNKIFAPNFNVLFKCNASARFFGGHWMALSSRLLHTAVSSHLVSDGTSWDSSGSELFPQSQDLPANLLIRCSLVLIWHLLCISPFLMDIWSRARIFTPGFTGAACFPNSLWFPVLGGKYTCSVKFCSTREHDIFYLESNAM